MTTMNASNSNGLKKFAPALYVLLGALLGGGGVYTLGLSRAPGKVHVGAPRPDLAMSRSQAASGQVAQSPAPIPDQEASDPSASAAVAARAEAAQAPGAAPQASRPEGDRRLAASGLSVQGQAATRAFQANATAAAVPAATSASAPKAFETPKLAARASVASGGIRYGLAGRSELMGRGAGPVYNLKGNAPAASSDVNSLIKQVGTMVKAADQQLDSASLPESDRRQIKQTLQSAAIATGQ